MWMVTRRLERDVTDMHASTLHGITVTRDRAFLLKSRSDTTLTRHHNADFSLNEAAISPALWNDSRVQRASILMFFMPDACIYK